jgi:transcriptional regulator with XRE-family HTH domain
MKKFEDFKLKSIREIRQEKGLTQEQLALKSGIKQQHLTQIETGKINPTVKTSKAIAEALGVETEDLMLGQTLENTGIEDRKEAIDWFLDIGKYMEAFENINRAVKNFENKDR